jgi:hypothetical protein
MTSFGDIHIDEYSDSSIVLRGDTRPFKEDIKKLGGKYNSRLQGGGGWIFSKTSKSKVQDFINKGVRLVSKDEILAGEERTNSFRDNREEYKSSDRLHTGHRVQSNTTESEVSNTQLMKKMNMLKTQMDRIEKLLSNIVVDEGEDEDSSKLLGEKEEDEEEEKDSEGAILKIPRKRLL